MKKFWFSVIILNCLGCYENIKNPIYNAGELCVKNFDAGFQKINNTWFYKKNLFTGFMIEVEKDNRIVYKLPISEGKENGLALGWYNSGEKLLKRHYENGLKEGEFMQWWPNGNLRYLFHYKHDKYNGTLTIFFPNGTKRQESNYQDGKEEGIQRVWNEEGLLVSNYIVKNTKMYGVAIFKSCIPISN